MDNEDDTMEINGESVANFVSTNIISHDSMVRIIYFQQIPIG